MFKSYDDISLNFLIASPELSDGVFEESVVFVLEDTPEGSIGLVINKPNGSTLGEISGEFSGEYLSSVEVFDAGPMNPSRVTLALWSGDKLSGGKFSFGVTADKIEEILRNNPDAKVCAFRGYSSWGAGQLKSEIEEGSWFVSRADISTMFNWNPSEMWRKMLVETQPEFGIFPAPRVDVNLN